MKGTAFLAASLLTAATPVLTQTPAAPSPSLVQPMPETTAPSRKPQIRMFADVLSAAVKSGAKDVANRMRITEPGSLFATSDAVTRGIELEGYGVFFDVDVPNMLQSVAWSNQMMQREQYLADLRTAIASLPEGPAKQFARSEMRRALSSDLPAAGAQARNVARTETTPAQPAAPGYVAPQTVDIPVVNNPLTERATLASPAADPNVLYTDSVKSALIDAMLNYSGALHLGDDEWLTVAARGVDGPSLPGQLDELASIIIRIKGSDLTAYATKKLPREEVLKRVQVREF